MDAFPKDPFAWISYKDGNKLVEVFEGLRQDCAEEPG